MTCENKVAVIVPKGWDYKTVYLRCGNTGPHGVSVFCEECDKANVKRGHLPNECRHGVNVFDHQCGRCEFE